MVEIICSKASEDDSAKSSRRELIGRMAIGIAHEIRNPLTVIKGYLQLQEKKSAYCTGDSLHIIYQELHRIETVITSIISLAQNKAIKRAPENLNRILENIYPVVKRAAARNGIVTELLLAEHLPMLDLNAAEIEELVLHLAYNGIEAMQPKGRLTIGAVQKSGKVILYVKDEGNGILPEQREQIFEPFYTTKSGNTGLGLAVSLSIIERHQGKIEIVSGMGVGSVFKVIFPVLQQAGDSAQDIPLPASG